MCATFAGSADSFPASSRQREASESESPPLERSGMMAGFGATRAIRDSRLRSPATGSRTNLVLPAGSAIFPGGETKRQRSVASGKWPCSRLLPMPWPGEASRPTTVSSAIGGASRRIAVVLAGRSLAASGIFFSGRARRFCLSRQFAAVGTKERKPGMEPMLFRRNAGLERLEWSGCKAGESGRCPVSQFVRGRNRADTWCEARAQVSAR